MRLLRLLQLSSKADMYYKMNFFLNLILISIFQLTRYLYVDSIFTYQSEFGSWSLSEATFAFLLSVSIAFGIESFTSSISSFCRKVYLGQADALLCKPVSPHFLFFFWGAKLSNLLLSLFIFILSILYYSTRIDMPISLWNMSLGLVAFALLLSANVLVFALASLTIFWAHRVIPVSYIFNQLFKLNLVPGSIYKKNLFTIFVFLAPTIVSSAIFISIFVFNQYEFLIYLLLSCSLLFTLFHILFLKALRHSPVHGG